MHKLNFLKFLLFIDIWICNISVDYGRLYDINIKCRGTAKANLLRKVFEGEYEPISHFITNRSEKYIALYNQFSEEQDFFMSIIPKEYHERFENMMGLIYEMNHEQNYSYYRAGIKLAAEIFLEAFKDEECDIL
ncbi:MAG: hypothetical protein IKK99_03785 [Oscillospiraceae bacterium]|nr:hypothetical protein [Oscillospiraceae bacterium]